MPPNVDPRSSAAAARASRRVRHGLSGRIVGALISLLLLAVLLRRVDPALLRQSLARTSATGWLVSFAAFGLTTAGMSLRWHLMAREAGIVVHPLASWRLCTMGHFFNTLLFGPVGGDTAKTALYHRYFAMPVGRIVTACVFDRILGLLSSVLMGLMLLPWVGFSASRARLPQLEFRLRAWHLGAVLAVAAAAFWWRRQAKRRPNPRARLMRRNMAPLWKRLRQKPGVLLAGLLTGLGIQLVWCGLLALQLWALNPASLPWLEMAWAFPLIGFIASTPFTIAGAGLREGAAILLLGLYGAPPADVAVASLGTFLVYVSWALIGLALWRREEALVARAPWSVSPSTLSVVIPSSPDREAMERTLQRLKAQPGVIEILIADDTVNEVNQQLAERFGARRILRDDPPATALHTAALAARGEVVWFLPAGSLIPSDACSTLLNALRDRTAVGGAFCIRSQTPGWIGSITAITRFAPALLGPRVSLDQNPFIRRRLLPRSADSTHFDTPLPHDLHRRGRFICV